MRASAPVLPPKNLKHAGHSLTFWTWFPMGSSSYKAHVLRLQQEPAQTPHRTRGNHAPLLKRKRLKSQLKERYLKTLTVTSIRFICTFNKTNILSSQQQCLDKRGRYEIGWLAICWYDVNISEHSAMGLWTQYGKTKIHAPPPDFLCFLYELMLNWCRKLCVPHSTSTVHTNKIKFNQSQYSKPNYLHYTQQSLV